MNKFFILSGILSFCLINIAEATVYNQNTGKPTCESMGFTKSINDCYGYYALRCPWDYDKVYCDCTYEYPYGISPGDPRSKSCRKYGMTYYEKPCYGTLPEDCLNTDGSSAATGDTCVGTNKKVYYANCAKDKACEIGDVLYSNKKCYAGRAPSIRIGSNTYNAIGVVFDATRGLAIALDENIGQNKNTNFGTCNLWGIGSDPEVIPEFFVNFLTAGEVGSLVGVPFYKHCITSTKPNNKVSVSSSYTSNHTSSASNGGYTATNQIVTNGSASNWPAAYYCKNYSKHSVSNWALPAPGDLNVLHNNLTKVNLTLRALNASPIRNKYEKVARGNQTAYLMTPWYWTAYIKNNWYWLWAPGINGSHRYMKRAVIAYNMRRGVADTVKSIRAGVAARCILKF